MGCSGPVCLMLLHDALGGDEVLALVRVADVRDLDAAGAGVDELVTAHVESHVRRLAAPIEGEAQDVARSKTVRVQGHGGALLDLRAAHPGQGDAEPPVRVLDEPGAVEPLLVGSPPLVRRADGPQGGFHHPGGDARRLRPRHTLWAPGTGILRGARARPLRLLRPHHRARARRQEHQEHDQAWDDGPGARDDDRTPG